MVSRQEAEIHRVPACLIASYTLTSSPLPSIGNGSESFLLDASLTEVVSLDKPPYAIRPPTSASGEGRRAGAEHQTYAFGKA